MKKLIAGNWKMHKTQKEAVETVTALVEMVSPLPEDREVLILPPYTSLSSVWNVIKDKQGFFLGGQNFYPAENGAFTGEISADMLLDVGCSFSLVGHSERRKYFKETDEFINQKVLFGLRKGLKIILCIGEELKERKEGKVFDVLKTQLLKGLKGVSSEDIENKLCIAYEPVWAIGTGEVATEDQIQEAHSLIRDLLIEMFDDKGKNIKILYGGSVSPENIKTILPISNVNGVLVGGASLEPEKFSKIILA